jgi:hypothetical protein
VRAADAERADTEAERGRGDGHAREL